jgi:hypothetical protein
MDRTRTRADSPRPRPDARGLRCGYGRRDPSVVVDEAVVGRLMLRHTLNDVLFRAAGTSDTWWCRNIAGVDTQRRC